MHALLPRMRSRTCVWCVYRHATLTLRERWQAGVFKAQEGSEAEVTQAVIRTKRLPDKPAEALLEEHSQPA